MNMDENNFEQLKKYYGHLVKIQQELIDFISDNRLEHLEPLVKNRLFERYFQLMIDDVKGIDKEYGMFMGEYSPDYKEDNRQKFLSNFIGYEFAGKTIGFGWMRNDIVHSPWIAESKIQKPNIEQLLICTQTLVDFMLKHWRCGHCKSVIPISDDKRLELEDEVICQKCKGKSIVISLTPLLMETIPTDLEKAQEIFDEAKKYHDFNNNGLAPFDPWYRKEADNYKKAEEYGHMYAPRELGLMYFYGQGCPKNFEQALGEWKTGGERGDTVCWGLIAAKMMESEENIEELWEKYFSGSTDNELAVELSAAYILYVVKSKGNIKYKDKLLPIREKIHEQLKKEEMNQTLENQVLAILESLKVNN